MTGSLASPVRPARERFANPPDNGQLSLPVCLDCGTVQYPVRDTCCSCLSPRLQFREVGDQGTVVATTVLYRSGDPRFAPSLPLRIATVRLDGGPVVIAHLPGQEAPQRVRVTAALDAFGHAVLTAHPDPLENKLE